MNPEGVTLWFWPEKFGGENVLIRPDGNGNPAGNPPAGGSRGVAVYSGAFSQ